MKILRRLEKEERENIEEQFENGLLYRLVCDVALHFSFKMPVLRLSPEEMAVAIAGMLDEIKENPEESRYLCQTFWDKLWYDISLMDERASEKEVSYAIIVTMALLVVCLLLVDSVRHRTLAFDLICVIQEHTSMHDLEQMQAQMNKFVWRMGEHRLKERIEQYWQSDMFLSDTIYEILHKDESEQQEVKLGKSHFRIAQKHKTNFAKILSAMFELRMFEDENGQIASNKQKLIEELGVFFDADYKNLSQLLNASKQNDNYIEIFEKMMEKAKKYDVK